MGILNSKLISFLYVKTSSIATKNDFRQTTLTELRCLPIRTIDFDNLADVAMHDEMVGLVERMLGLHKGYADLTDVQRSVVDAQIARVDRAIDALVYRLYGLSEDEVGVVEGG